MAPKICLRNPSDMSIFLKLGHHGFSGSNTEGYLEALHPEYVFQTGCYATMPSDVVETLQRIGARYYSSDDITRDGKNAFEVSLTPFGIETNANYQAPHLYYGDWRNGHYHMYRNGVPVATQGWVKTDNGWTWFNGGFSSYDGNWVLDSGKWYWIRSDGEMAVSWCVANGSWYYFDASGAMQTGWLYDGGSWYWLNPSGAMAIGWCLINGDWYYLSGSGAMQTGWITDGGNWYYLNSSGLMLTGWIELGSDWYYLDASGAMKVDSWIGDYYVMCNGLMARNAWIGEYYVGPDGKWIPDKRLNYAF